MKTPNRPLSIRNTGTRIVGKSTVLKTDGSIVTPNVPPQPGENLITYRDDPRQYVLSTKGNLQKAGTVAGGTRTWPLVAFQVDWTIEGTSFRTLVDGNSDQFLTLVAEQVIVTPVWDEENGRVVISGLPNLNYPAEMVMQASLCAGEGLQTKAFRTRILGTTGDVGTGWDSQIIQIPYLAKGVIIRQSSDPAWLSGTMNFQFNNSGPINVDFYTSAALTAAHNLGIYLPVPSLADNLFIHFPAGAQPVGPGSVEFLLEP